MERTGPCSRWEVLGSLWGQSSGEGGRSSLWSKFSTINHRAPAAVDNLVMSPQAELVTSGSEEVITTPACQIRHLSGWMCPESEPLLKPHQVRSEEVAAVESGTPSRPEQLNSSSVVTYKRRARSEGGCKVPAKAGAKPVVRRRQLYKLLVRRLAGRPYYCIPSKELVYKMGLESARCKLLFCKQLWMFGTQQGPRARLRLFGGGFTQKFLAHSHDATRQYKAFVVNPSDVSDFPANKWE